MLAYFQRTPRRQSPQNTRQCQDHRPGVRPYQAPGSPSAAARMQPPPRSSEHFPHSLIQDPRGFLLPRFVNAGRHLPAAHVAPRPASKNLQDCGPSLRNLPTSASVGSAAIFHPVSVPSEPMPKQQPTPFRRRGQAFASIAAAADWIASSVTARSSSVRARLGYVLPGDLKIPWCRNVSFQSFARPASLACTDL